jgi:replication initiation protein RepC
MLETDKLARGFTGKPEGDGLQKPGQVLAAFKAAAPYMDFGPRIVHAIDWLFTFTQPQDWMEGSHPIVWPSAALQRQALDLGVTQAKALNRLLVELGLVVMKDSPNGKRFGRRDAKRRIIEAYGFDLAPLAARQAEFEAAAVAGRAERECIRKLRRRATIARNGLTQILETAGELGFTDPDWQRLAQEAGELGRSLLKMEGGGEELEFGVALLERRQIEAREWLESLLPQAVPETPESVDSDPLGSENRPHQYTYKPTLNPEKDTVVASEESSAPDGGEVPAQVPPVTQPTPQEAAHRQPARTDNGTVLRLSTDEVVALAPRLRPYLRTSAPSWPDIVDAADFLRHDLGVSRPLWGEACLAMGREQAAIALAIVSAKPAGHFTSSPGGYFHGMVAKAKAGTLNLARTVWGLRRARAPGGQVRTGRGADRGAQTAASPHWS